MQVVKRSSSREGLASLTRANHANSVQNILPVTVNDNTVLQGIHITHDIYHRVARGNRALFQADKHGCATP